MSEGDDRYERPNEGEKLLFTQSLKIQYIIYLKNINFNFFIIKL